MEHKFFARKPMLEEVSGDEEFVQAVINFAIDHPLHFLATVEAAIREDAQAKIEANTSLDKEARNAANRDPHRRLRVARLVERAAELAVRLEDAR